MADRIGDVVTFNLPAQKEREDIIKLYTRKTLADKPVEVSKGFTANIPYSANLLEGVSPRRIKYIVQESIREARMQKKPQLTHTITKSVVQQEQVLHATKQVWEKQKQEWAAKLSS